MQSGKEMKEVLQDAWHEETARNSIERWNNLCEQEHWPDKPGRLPLLVKIFGASWYFTRYIFVNGPEAAGLIDQDHVNEFGKNYYINFLSQALEADDIEKRTDRLRILKNACMLQILIAFLKGGQSQQKLEYLLTDLAEATLDVLITSYEVLPQHATFPVTVLGMGRMAGHEMIFGSDLDLIFLYESEDHELYARLGKTIRLLLRTIAQPASAGSLYDIDMRLRPHGNSGPLVTSYKTFVEYHSGNRDIWEKQMMTRCRPVLVRSTNVEPVLKNVNEHVYVEYDKGFLKQEIVNMRMKVQKQLGSPKGRYEIKRGYGGIMDIDFITHYFQLGYGHEYQMLQTTSTRSVLDQARKLNLIDTGVAGKLTGYYDYLKRVEMCLRLFDLKSVDSFTTFEQDNLALSRAMGHGDDTRSFIDEYESVTHSVRKYFLELLE